MEKVPVTVQGLEKIKKELNELKKTKRPKIIEAIAEARAHGDLKENAEYHAAKEQQALIESRIREIESKLANAQVIDITQIHLSVKVIFGTTVQVEDLKEGELVTYKIVGEDEADVKLGKISIHSPLSRNLIGKCEGDSFKFETPSGIKEYDVISIKHL